MWTLVTSGQVASMARRLRSAEWLADHRRDAVGAVEHRAAGGDLGDVVDEDDAAVAEPLDDGPVVDDLVVDVERAAEELAAPVSRLSMAMLTPAQNPRGLARMIFIRSPPVRRLWYAGGAQPANRRLMGRGNKRQTPPSFGWRSGRSRRVADYFLDLDLRLLDDLLAVLLADLAGDLDAFLSAVQQCLWYGSLPPLSTR